MALRTLALGALSSSPRRPLSPDDKGNALLLCKQRCLAAVLKVFGYGFLVICVLLHVNAHILLV